MEWTSRKGFTLGLKDIAFIVAILVFIVIVVFLVEMLLLGEVPEVVNQLVDTMLGGLVEGQGSG